MRRPGCISSDRLIGDYTLLPLGARIADAGVMVTKPMRPVPGSLPALAMLALLVLGLAGKAVADSV